MLGADMILVQEPSLFLGKFETSTAVAVQTLQGPIGTLASRCDKGGTGNGAC
jgi:hypothetical protein